DVMRVTILGRSTIILGSQQAATDLLEKRSGIYSDRPETPVYDIMGWSVNLAFTKYASTRFRKLKKMFQQNLSPKACVQFQHVQTENAHMLVNDLIQNKGNYVYLVGRIAYGHQIRSDDDEYIKIGTEGANGFLVGGTPGATMIDYCEALPGLVSGYALCGNSAHMEARCRLNAQLSVRLKMVRREGPRNSEAILATELQCRGEQVFSDEDVSVLKGVAGAVHAGGTETTSASPALFAMAMLSYPERQKRRQGEVDRVVGRDMFPTFEDKKSLPYRFLHLTSFSHCSQGIAHHFTDDDTYRGMFIPKGSVVIANLRGISLDENMYKNPTDFNPNRFLPK
ncbi:cytochrome P450, partial [Pleurotus eryngii]